jgi:hypothetical protein
MDALTVHRSVMGSRSGVGFIGTIMRPTLERMGDRMRGHSG